MTQVLFNSNQKSLHLDIQISHPSNEILSNDSTDSEEHPDQEENQHDLFLLLEEKKKKIKKLTHLLKTKQEKNSSVMKTFKSLCLAQDEFRCLLKFMRLSDQSKNSSIHFLPNEILLLILDFLIGPVFDKKTGKLNIRELFLEKLIFDSTDVSDPIFHRFLRTTSFPNPAMENMPILRQHGCGAMKKTRFLQHNSISEMLIGTGETYYRLEWSSQTVLLLQSLLHSVSIIRNLIVYFPASKKKRLCDVTSFQFWEKITSLFPRLEKLVVFRNDSYTSYGEFNFDGKEDIYQFIVDRLAKQREILQNMERSDNSCLDENSSTIEREMFDPERFEVQSPKKTTALTPHERSQYFGCFGVFNTPGTETQMEILKKLQSFLGQLKIFHIFSINDENCCKSSTPSIKEYFSRTPRHKFSMRKDPDNFIFTKNTLFQKKEFGNVLALSNEEKARYDFLLFKTIAALGFPVDLEKKSKFCFYISPGIAVLLLSNPLFKAQNLIMSGNK